MGVKKHRYAWPASVLVAAVMLVLGIPLAAQASAKPASLQRAEAVHIIGHRVINGKTYPVVYVPGARRYRNMASPLASGSGTLVNHHSGKCGEVYHSQTNNGANVDQYSCNGTLTQLWYFDYWGEDQFDNPIGNIININSGKCFEVYNWGAGNGANVDQWNCAPLSQSHTNQLWDIDGPFVEALGASQYRGLSVVAEVNGWSTSNKGNVDIWQNYADSNQMWDVNFGT